MKYKLRILNIREIHSAESIQNVHNDIQQIYICVCKKKYLIIILGKIIIGKLAKSTK